MRRSSFAGGLLVWPLAACVPELRSNETGAPTSDWQAPDNTWPHHTPPAGLEGEGFSEGQVVPDVRATDQFGDEVALWQFYGDVIVLDVSTIWCAPCRELAESVNEVYQAYKDQGFMYVTLLPQNNVGEVPTVEDLQDWASTYGITAPVLSDGQGYSYQVVPDNAYPAVLVIGRDMKVKVDRVTPTTDAAIRAAVEQQL